MNATSLTADMVHRATKRAVSLKLMGLFAGTIFLFSIVFILMFRALTLDLLQTQVKLRAESVANVLAAAVLPHVAVGDYLSINNVTTAAAQLQGIGYIAVINSEGRAIAGAFGEKEKFTSTLMDEVKDNGFPKQLAAHIRLGKGVNAKTSSVPVGEQVVIEHGLRLGATDAEVHVGLLAYELPQLVDVALLPYLILVIATIILGSITVFFSAGAIVASFTTVRI